MLDSAKLFGSKAAYVHQKLSKMLI